ncbi:MAG: glycosyltransferase [Bacteroidales bacterium]|nr:glycosyltransferase [Candidatus Cryptobacteroides aphodequi]
MPCETKQGLISVIICTYNRGEYIYSVLESLAKNDFPTDRYEIVLDKTAYVR